jgi:hypothetical protein
MVKEKTPKKRKREREQADPDIEANIKEFRRLLADLSEADRARVLTLMRQLLAK